MATQILIRHICDNGQEVSDEEGIINTVPISFDGVSYETDLCEKCRTELKDILAPWLAQGRKAGKAATSSKRTRKYKGDLIPVEHSEDGKFHCPECGRVTGTSGSGLGLHMRDKHPAERDKYRIIEPPRQVAAKKAAPRKKATPAKKTARRRRS